jgi:hypothetical protein
LIVSVGKSGLIFAGPVIDLPALREQFDQEHYIRFSDFVESEILDFIQRQIDAGEFYQRVHEGIGSNKELCMAGNAGFGALLLMMNDEKLFQVIQAVAQCARIRCFEGRVYRVNAGQGHHDSWHNDVGEHRLVGMTINLGNETYSGGTLQIRERESRRIINEAPNLNAGDAVIFRLSDKLQHRITGVEGSASKTAFAGWFKAEPNFSIMLRSQSRRGKAVQGFEARLVTS